MAYKKKITMKDATDDMSMRQAFADFIETKTADNLSASTVKNYVYTFEKFFSYNEFAEDELCSVLDEGKINKWKNHLLKEDISFQSVNHYVRDIKTFLTYCWKMGYCEKFEVQQVRGQEQSIKYYTADEMEALLEKPVGNQNYGAWRTWAIVCFIYATGARAQSVCDVKITDIDYYHKEIIFRHQKNKTLLKLPMSDELEKCLRSFIKKFGLENEEWLFCEITGEQLTPNALRLAINRYAQSRGVEPKGSHALRHAFASQYIRNGGNPVLLQRIMNHASFKTTERYLHLFGDDLKETYNEISPLDVASKKKSRSKKIGK